MGVIQLGWIEPKNRTEEQHEAHEDAVASMPKFAIQGGSKGTPAVGTKVLLTDTWKHPTVVASIGQPFTGIHQFTGSCFPKGTPVRMADGNEKPIELVDVGDEVISHTGHHRIVVETMQRKYTGEMIRLNVGGFAFPLEMTADHQVAILPSRCDWRWQPGEIDWVRADELQEGDRVLIGWDKTKNDDKILDVAKLIGDAAIVLDDLMERGEAPVSNIGMAQYCCKRSGVDWKGKIKLIRSRNENAINRHIPIGPSLARFIGLYLAEGGCHEGRVVFTFSATEDHLAGEVLALAKGLFGADGEKVYQEHRPNVLKVQFNNNTLAAILKALMSGNVYSKRVPGIFFGADEPTKLAVILGWMDGDGYEAIRPDGDVRIQGVTVCADLARDITTLALSCGMRAACSKRKARKQSRAAYNVYLSGRKAMALFPAVASHIGTMQRMQDTDTARTQHGYARTIKRIDRRQVETMEVFDFEVECDHSFLAGGLVVHNCVGAGGGNMLASLGFLDVLQRGEQEKIIIPLWLFTYGKSRARAGMRGRGEGSLGSTFAAACQQDGIADATLPGAPPFTWTDGLCWGANDKQCEATELAWSDGAAIPQSWADESHKHLVQTSSPLNSAEQVRDAILNYYPVTRAFGSFANPGSPKVLGGSDPALVGTYDGNGGHQETWQGYWNHPELGELIWEQNQWGLSVYGNDPGGGPAGGCWIRMSEVDRACRSRDAEIYAFSNVQGYPARNTTDFWP